MQTETRHPRIGAVLVAEAMHPGVFTCEREALLSEVAAQMAGELVHCIVVESGSGEAGPPWGIVSDFDLVATAPRQRRRTRSRRSCSKAILWPA